MKIFCLTQRRNDATLIRVSGRHIAPLVERGIIRRNARRGKAIVPYELPQRLMDFTKRKRRGYKPRRASETRPGFQGFFLFAS